VKLINEVLCLESHHLNKNNEMVATASDLLQQLHPLQLLAEKLVILVHSLNDRL